MFGLFKRKVLVKIEQNITLDFSRMYIVTYVNPKGYLIAKNLKTDENVSYCDPELFNQFKEGDVLMGNLDGDLVINAIKLVFKVDT